MHIVTFVVSAALAAGPAPSAEPPGDAPSRILEVPEVAGVTPVLTDGVLDDGEWSDAAALPLGGVELLAKRDARYLYLALRFVDGKHSGLDLYLASSPEVRRMFHISSELGTERFEDGHWSERSWNVRGWVGNPIGYNHDPDALVIYEPDGLELQFSRAMLAAEGLGGPGLRVALRLKRPDLTVPEGAEQAPLDEWVELKLPDGAGEPEN